jgi:hypothetical protein
MTRSPEWYLLFRYSEEEKKTSYGKYLQNKTVEHYVEYKNTEK